MSEKSLKARLKELNFAENWLIKEYPKTHHKEDEDIKEYGRRKVTEVALEGARIAMELLESELDKHSTGCHKCGQNVSMEAVRLTIKELSE